MSDPADIATENLIVFETAALKSRKPVREINVTGICENCGNQIEEARRKANPYATLCIDCAEEREQQVRMRKLRGF